MQYMILRLLVLCFLIFSLSACEDNAPAPAPPPAVKKTAAAETKKVEPQQAPAPEEVKPPEYVYSSEGQRDPFMPLSRLKSPVANATAVPLTPLQKFDVGQYRLIGVIIGKGEPRAMVVAPDGKSYVLKKGVLIGKNNGKIIDINNSGVQVEEKYYDFTGSVRTGIQEIKLPPRQGV